MRVNYCNHRFIAIVEEEATDRGMSLTPNQLRQLRETIETLATIAEGNSTATETVNHAGTAL